MPDIGETWSFVDLQSSSRVEAIVIATGPTAIRLVDRYGRRITVPPSALSHVWRREHLPPSPERRCHQCSQAAYFRFVNDEGDITWGCEEHFPLGIRAHLPGDLLEPRSAAPLHCPRCRSTQVVALPLVALSNRRTAARSLCQACHVEWSALPGRGLADDGARLAADLRHIVETSVQEIRLGFTAYRSLCRAMNIGDIAHISGVPVRSDSTIGDLLTIVFFVVHSTDRRTERPEDHPGPARFCGVFNTPTIAVGQVWRKRTVDGNSATHCSLLRVQDDQVTYHLQDCSSETTIPAPLFRRCWSPGVAPGPPRETSVWVHRETRQLVQVLQATAVQAANDQTHYVTAEGQRETTPARTFMRLYRELPTPPEDHLWFHEGEVFAVERAGDMVAPQPQWPRVRELPQVMEAARLYSTCQPVVLTETFGALRANEPWINKSNSEDTVTVVDVGVVDATPSRFVRFRGADGSLNCEELYGFCERYRHDPPPPPCSVGETWFHREHCERQCVIQKDDPILRLTTVKWRNDGAVEVLSHERLITDYRKLEVRTYWEILESDDS